MLDVSKANRLQSRLWDIGQELLSGGSEGEAFMQKLLNFPDPVVQAQAANVSIYVHEAQAVDTLQRIRAMRHEVASSLRIRDIIQLRWLFTSTRSRFFGKRGSKSPAAAILDICEFCRQAGGGLALG